MKILLFTDTHSSNAHIETVRKKAANADIVVCLGDFTMFQAYMKNFLKEINGFGKKVLMIPGNHENEEELEKACMNMKNIVYMHKRNFEVDNILFLGYGTGGFAERDIEFEETAKVWKEFIKKKHSVVLLTHGPPHNTVIDIVGKNHVGNKSYREFIDKFHPVLAASGHLHENFYKVQKIGDTTVMNPGPDGRIFVVD